MGEEGWASERAKQAGRRIPPHHTHTLVAVLGRAAPTTSPLFGFSSRLLPSTFLNGDAAYKETLAADSSFYFSFLLAVSDEKQ